MNRPMSVIETERKIQVYLDNQADLLEMKRKIDYTRNMLGNYVTSLKRLETLVAQSYYKSKEFLDNETARLLKEICVIRNQFEQGKLNQVERDYRMELVKVDFEFSQQACSELMNYVDQSQKAIKHIEPLLVNNTKMKQLSAETFEFDVVRSEEDERQLPQCWNEAKDVRSDKKYLYHPVSVTGWQEEVGMVEMNPKYEDEFFEERQSVSSNSRRSRHSSARSDDISVSERSKGLPSIQASKSKLSDDF